MTDRGKIDTNPPTGTRDFLPDVLERREHAVQTIKGVFSQFGFQQMQTPAFERLEILTGKYGEDEKLIFKIQRRGERAAEGADLALRYDLTVPLARFVAKYRSQLPGVFRRFQIGPVWRADRPGKGRFREFWQCDVDIVGSASPMADSDILLAISSGLTALGLPDFEIRLNSRKVLAELMNRCGIPESLQRSALIALDKLDKIGPSGVEEELVSRQIPLQAIDMLRPILNASPDSDGSEVKALLQDTASGSQSLHELYEIQQLVEPLLETGRIRFSPLLARGLDYYTGMIFEVYAKDFPSAIASGGRYDGLLGMFLKGDQTIPACGGSIGLERVLELLETTDSRAPTPSAQVLVTVWDNEYRRDALRLANDLRKKGIATETYLGTDAIGKQLRYASTKKIPFVIVQGPDEHAAGEVQVKNMSTGVQAPVKLEDVIDYVIDQASAAK